MMKAMQSRTFVEHVRGMFQPALLRDLRRYLNAIDAERPADAQTDREKAAINRGESSEALRMDVRWYDVWRNATPHMLDAVRPYTWVVFPPQVRIVREIPHSVPWHQDIGYQKLLGPRAHRQVITFFLKNKELFYPDQ